MGNEKQTPKLTFEQQRILLVANWLKRYSAIYPMYGKTLVDFPERSDEFLEEFRHDDPALLDEAFAAARGACTEFPTPADIRKLLSKIQVPAERVQLAYERRKQAQLAGPAPKLLESVLDEPKPKAKRPLRLLTEAEHAERVEFLKKQVQQLTEEA